MSTTLVINSGSSSLKCALWADDGKRLLVALGECLHTPDAVLHCDVEHSIACPGADHREVLRLFLDFVQEKDLLREVGAVGHRVVHGGEAFQQATIITEEVLAQLEAVSGLAPLHNPANIAGIQATREVLPGVPQVAVFDTAFHQTMPDRAYRYAVPAAWYERYSVRRYGFHGTSHRYVAQKCAELLD